jgi:hypothetical protein
MELDDWLEPYRQMWRDSLGRLEDHLTDLPDIQEEEVMNEATLLSADHLRADGRAGCWHDLRGVLGRQDGPPEGIDVS